MQKTASTTLISAALLATAATPGTADTRSFDTQAVKLNAEIIADGLQNPWGLDFLPNGEAIVTERPGRMRILTKEGLSEPIAGVPTVHARGQGGLLDIAIATDFETSGTVFFTFSEPGWVGAGTALPRGRLVPDGRRGQLDDVKVIFSMSK